MRRKALVRENNLWIDSVTLALLAFNQNVGVRIPVGPPFMGLYRIRFVYMLIKRKQDIVTHPFKLTKNNKRHCK